MLNGDLHIVVQISLYDSNSTTIDLLLDRS
jgi:hypothetical protein